MGDISCLEKSICCGCSACEHICPKNSIRMEIDSEGFLYPRIDMDTCVNCGRCASVCQGLLPSSERPPMKALAAMCQEESLRLQSSSGGMFSTLATTIINAGGVVFGACFGDGWQVIIDYTETVDGLSKFRGSKYVQAKTGTAYIDAQNFLKRGRLVLFTGTPCLVRGLRHFLRDQYSNLITIDVACHGVPSPKVWKMYLQALTNRANKKHVDTIISMYHKDVFMQAFLENLTLRPSCYNCKAKLGRSGSDLTISDFWGVQHVCPQMHDDKGTSLILINTEKGREFIEHLPCQSMEVVFGEVLWHNPYLKRCPNVHPKRSVFFAHLEDANDVITLMKNCLKQPLKQRVKNLLKEFLNVQNYKRAFRLRRMYFQAVKIGVRDLTLDNISSIDFRSKLLGWTNYCVKVKWNGSSQK